MKTIKNTILVVITLLILAGLGYFGKLGYNELEWKAFKKYEQTGAVTFPFSEHRMKIMHYEQISQDAKNSTILLNI